MRLQDHLIFVPTFRTVRTRPFLVSLKHDIKAAYCIDWFIHSCLLHFADFNKKSSLRKKTTAKQERKRTVQSPGENQMILQMNKFSLTVKVGYFTANMAAVLGLH